MNRQRSIYWSKHDCSSDPPVKNRSWFFHLPHRFTWRHGVDILVFERCV